MTVIPRADPPALFINIMRAREALRGVVHETPLDLSRTFSKLSGGKVYLKLENLQRTGSFKIRGAYYKIYRLGEEAKKRGVITASAGNHAQGVALASSLLGVKATVVMPENTPVSKVIATKSYGTNVNVILHGKTYDDSYRKSMELSAEGGPTFIHPFDDPDVIAGQGTVGVEILEGLGAPDVVVVPVGGGGLISGIAVALKTLAGSRVKVIGVEAEACPSVKTSLGRGEPVEVEARPTIADGILVKKPGELTLEIMEKFVDDVVLVSDREIAKAIFILLERGKILAEGAGAASLAALLSGKLDLRGKRAVFVVSGGNIDLTLLSKIISRELVASGRVARIQGFLPDVPGSLNAVLAVIGALRSNVIDVEHDRLDPALEPGWARVDITIEVPDPTALGEILRQLSERGYSFKVVR